MLYHASSTAGRGNRQEVTITFSRPVRGLKFYVTDIDTITSPAYSDRVELTAKNAANGNVPFGYVNDGITGAGRATATPGCAPRTATSARTPAAPRHRWTSR